MHPMLTIAVRAARKAGNLIAKNYETPDAVEASQKGTNDFVTNVDRDAEHLIIDVIRKRGREVHIEPIDEQSMDDAMDALFAKDGHWQEPPPAWQQPEKSLEQRQFFETLQSCVDRLPAKVGRVFMMREWLDKEVEDICEELGITATNCGVMLYRARMRLRECLERNWFAGQR